MKTADNKGAALAYSLMLTMVVFSICALVLTVMLSQIQSSDIYTDNARLESEYTQIGELYYSASGDRDKFGQLLGNSDYEVEVQDDNQWVLSGEYKLLLEFSTAKDALSDTIARLTIMSLNKTPYLTVGVNKEGQLIQWSKGKMENDKTEGVDSV